MSFFVTVKSNVASGSLLLEFVGTGNFGVCVRASDSLQISEVDEIVCVGDVAVECESIKLFGKVDTVVRTCKFGFEVEVDSE